ncbi:MAG TPA: hypothetical protein VHO90_10195 [Bacteroidales bacterium]|nr:hypothetical protein [Bacteroidales bacterium]
MSVADRTYLIQAGIRKIYLRVFDIDYFAETKTTRGVASVVFQKAPFSGFEYVPVVYITNKTFLNTSIEKIDSLALNTL